MTRQTDPQERRGSSRINSRIRVLFSRGGTGVAIEAETDNISVDGLFVRTKRRPPEVGTALGLLLKLDDPPQELLLKGIVTRVGELVSDAEQASRGMGISFVDLDEETRSVLTQALERAEEANAAREVDDGGA